MLNVNGISHATRSLCASGEKLNGLAMAVVTADKMSGSLKDAFETMLYDELEHIQMMTLELTKLCTDLNADEAEGSVFAEGDLTDAKKGDVGDDDDEEEDTTTQDEP